VGRPTTAPLDHVVSTFWLPDGKPPEEAVMHVYGPYTKSQARAVARRMNAEELPEHGVARARAKRVMDVDPDGVGPRYVTSMTTATEPTGEDE
jgi:hypothetical protein